MQTSSLSRGKENLSGKSVKELLLFVGNETKGGREEAMEILLHRDFNSIYRVLEDAIRNDDEADLRSGAMEILVKFGPRSVNKLVRLLSDANEEVRNFSTVMLGEIKSGRAVDGLIEALSDADPNVRQGAAEALAKIKDRRGVKPLLSLLEEDFFLRYTAIVALGEMKDKRAFPCLIKLLHDEIFSEPVAEALGLIGEPAALSPLGQMLDTANGSLLATIARAIVSIQESVEHSLRYKNSLINISARNFISDAGRENLRLLIDKFRDEKTVAAAVKLLGRLKDTSSLPVFFELLVERDYMFVMEGAILAMGEEALPFLQDALRHDDDRVKLLAVRSMRWIGDDKDYSRLYPLLYSSNTDLQVEVLHTLEGTVDLHLYPRLVAMLREASPTLIPCLVSVMGHYPWMNIKDYLLPLANSQDSHHRHKALQALGRMDDTIPFPLFAKFLHDTDPLVRGEAIHVAGKKRVKEALPLLVETLHDPQDTVRAEAVSALAEFADPAFGPILLPLLKKEEDRTTYVAIQALGRIGGRVGAKTIVPFLSKEGRIQYAAIVAIGKLCDPSVIGELAACLDHDDADIRRRTVDSLACFADEQVFPYLENALNDRHWSVRIAAANALAKSGNTTAVKGISNLLNDADLLVRHAAVTALGETRSAAAVPILVVLLADVELGDAVFDALLRIGSKGLTRLHHFAEGDLFEEAKEKVVDLLGKIGDPKSSEVLLRLLQDSNAVIRAASIDAFIHFCNDAAKTRLEEVMANDPDSNVRERAQAALKAIGDGCSH